MSVSEALSFAGNKYSCVMLTTNMIDMFPRNSTVPPVVPHHWNHLQRNIQKKTVSKNINFSQKSPLNSKNEPMNLYVCIAGDSQLSFRSFILQADSQTGR